MTIPDDGKIPKPRTGIQRIWNAFFYSADGLRHAFVHEAAFRQEILLSCILLPAALLLPVSPLMKLLLIADNIIVLITELLNSAVESLTDKICSGFDPFAKQAKDMGSAAVLLSLINLGIGWGFALYSVWAGS
ncbi:MAG: diacylglycerol kinase [Desulfococcaceae bacterium]